MKGLIERRNKQNHCVIRLHYSADVKKDNRWVKSESSKYIGGTNSLLWRREFEIDFGAGSGELVFPTFPDLESRLLVDPFEIDDTYNLFGGFDWGRRNPLAFVVYAESTNHLFYAVWEYYLEGRDRVVPLREIAKVMKKECPFYERINCIYADPSIWNDTQVKKDGFTSIAEMLGDDEEVGEDYVIDKLTPSHDRSDAGAIVKFENMWSVEPARFRIFKTCYNLINEFRNLKYKERSDSLNEPEKILDKNNDLWDTAKYFILSHPYAKTMEVKPQYGTLEYINKISELARSISDRTGQSVQSAFNDLYGT